MFLFKEVITLYLAKLLDIFLIFKY